jgi:hypothetical protein
LAVGLVKSPDQVRSAADFREAAPGEAAGYSHRFGHILRPIVKSGQQMAVIIDAVLSFEF